MDAEYPDPTWVGAIHSLEEALVIIYAADIGLLPQVVLRPDPDQLFRLVYSGSVIVFNETTSGMQRWYDAGHWGTARTRDRAFYVYNEVLSTEPAEKQLIKFTMSCLAQGGRRDGQGETFHLVAYMSEENRWSAQTVQQDPILRDLVVPDHYFSVRDTGRSLPFSNPAQTGPLSQSRAPPPSTSAHERRRQDSNSPSASAGPPRPRYSPYSTPLPRPSSLRLPFSSSTASVSQIPRSSSSQSIRVPQVPSRTATQQTTLPSGSSLRLPPRSASTAITAQAFSSAPYAPSSASIAMAQSSHLRHSLPFASTTRFTSSTSQSLPSQRYPLIPPSSSTGGHQWSYTSQGVRGLMSEPQEQHSASAPSSTGHRQYPSLSGGTTGTRHYSSAPAVTPAERWSSSYPIHLPPLVPPRPPTPPQLPAPVPTPASIWDAYGYGHAFRGEVLDAEGEREEDDEDN
ncbi:hypothetical protein BT69DRAFT_1319548 [Atractiella rhizophila]|nr:hypothetical protein BT69DRAFT_1319548 [Atractiella rhizophila]